MIPDEERCCEQVRGSGAWPRYHRCRRRGVVTEDGKLFCKQHSSAAKDARLQKAVDKFNDRCSKMKRQHKLEKLAQGIPTNELDQYELVRKG